MRTLTISDELAARLEARRQRLGEASLDAVAEALIAEALVAGAPAEAPAADDDVRALLAEAEADGC